VTKNRDTRRHASDAGLALSLCMDTVEKLEDIQGAIGRADMVETTFCRRRSGYPCLRLAIWEVRCSVYIPIHQRPTTIILLATFFYSTRHVAGGRNGKGKKGKLSDYKMLVLVVPPTR
jgi:hypothetical protein